MAVETAALLDIVSKYPGLTAREILKLIPVDGLVSRLRITKRQVNRELYSLERKNILCRVADNGKPRWYLEDGAASSGDFNDEIVFSGMLHEELGLYSNLHSWQKEALNWWGEQDYCGVVEAVTGAGKTRLAIAAAELQLRRNKPTVIIVPTVELMRQWERELLRHLGNSLGLNFSVGLFGNGRKDSLEGSDILITTPHSGAKYYLLPEGWDGLIIADEVHRYGGSTWSLVLEEGFDRRLGLTATYERPDNGVENFLEPYFGVNIFKVDYKRALRDSIIAEFKIAFVGVKFTSQERKAYEEAEKKARKFRNELLNFYGLTAEPFGTFMQEVQQLKSSEAEGSKKAGFYLSAFDKRRKTLAEAHQKFEKLSDLSNAVKRADRSILFAQTQNASKEAVERLSEKGINGAILTSEMDMTERKDVFAAFEDGDHELVAAPRLLDEGIDVPNADLAIILASSRSKRQMVQRMGRVIRKKKDGRLARLVVMYVENTSEEPGLAHEDFLDLVTGEAHEIRHFPSGSSPKSICKYLNNWNP